MKKTTTFTMNGSTTERKSTLPKFFGPASSIPPKMLSSLLISRTARSGSSNPTPTIPSCFLTDHLNQHILSKAPLCRFFPTLQRRNSESLQIVISDIRLAADAQHAKKERSKNHLQTKE